MNISIILLVIIIIIQEFQISSLNRRFRILADVCSTLIALNDKQLKTIRELADLAKSESVATKEFMEGVRDAFQNINH